MPEARSGRRQRRDGADRQRRSRAAGHLIGTPRDGRLSDDTVAAAGFERVLLC